MVRLETERDLDDVLNLLKDESGAWGMEVAPFLVKWYNGAVKDEKFTFNVSGNTLAFVVVSGPSMFERAFLPFVLREGQKVRDPLDECMIHHFQRLRRVLPPGFDVEPIHDFELSSGVSKRPKVLVQTAGHVAGIVRFYQQQDLEEDGLEKLKELTGSSKVPRVFPVCVHPRYGGWFGLRGILLCKNVTVNFDLARKDPPAICQTQDEIAKLLYLFNYHWRDWQYRDVGMSSGVERYSKLQMEYFGLAPDKRKEFLVKEVFDKVNDEDSDFRS